MNFIKLCPRLLFTTSRNTTTQPVFFISRNYSPLADKLEEMPLPPYAEEVNRRAMAGEFDALLAEFAENRSSNPSWVTNDKWEALIGAAVGLGQDDIALQLYEDAKSAGFLQGPGYMPVDDWRVEVDALSKLGGGFARSSADQLDFIRDFEHKLAKQPKQAFDELKANAAKELHQDQNAPKDMVDEFARLMQNATPQDLIKQFNDNLADPEIQKIIPASFLDSIKETAPAMLEQMATMPDDFKKRMIEELSEMVPHVPPSSPLDAEVRVDRATDPLEEKRQDLASLSDEERQAYFQRLDENHDQVKQKTASLSKVLAAFQSIEENQEALKNDTDELWQARWQFINKYVDQHWASRADAPSTSRTRLVEFLAYTRENPSIAREIKEKANTQFKDDPFLNGLFD